MADVPRCWNCWGVGHSRTMCQKRNLTPAQSDVLRKTLGIPIPKEKLEYANFLQASVCFNCWKCSGHIDANCSEPHRSLKERELLRCKLGVPLPPEWGRILADKGYRPFNEEMEEDFEDDDYEEGNITKTSTSVSSNVAGRKQVIAPHSKKPIEVKPAGPTGTSHCWNCWKTDHVTKDCKQARFPNWETERRRKELGLPVPTPEGAYEAFLDNLPCFNCWRTTDHWEGDCPEPQRSLGGREQQRFMLKRPCPRKWREILENRGRKPMGTKTQNISHVPEALAIRGVDMRGWDNKKVPDAAAAVEQRNRELELWPTVQGHDQNAGRQRQKLVAAGPVKPPAAPAKPQDKRTEIIEILTKAAASNGWMPPHVRSRIPADILQEFDRTKKIPMSLISNIDSAASVTTGSASANNKETRGPLPTIQEQPQNDENIDANANAPKKVSEIREGDPETGVSKNALTMLWLNNIDGNQSLQNNPQPQQPPPQPPMQQPQNLMDMPLIEMTDSAIQSSTPNESSVGPGASASQQDNANNLDSLVNLQFEPSADLQNMFTPTDSDMKRAGAMSALEQARQIIDAGGNINRAHLHSIMEVTKNVSGGDNCTESERDDEEEEFSEDGTAKGNYVQAPVGSNNVHGMRPLASSTPPPEEIPSVIEYVTVQANSRDVRDGSADGHHNETLNANHHDAPGELNIHSITSALSHISHRHSGMESSLRDIASLLKHAFPHTEQSANPHDIATLTAKFHKLETDHALASSSILSLVGDLQHRMNSIEDRMASSEMATGFHEVLDDVQKRLYQLEMFTQIIQPPAQVKQQLRSLPMQQQQSLPEQQNGQRDIEGIEPGQGIELGARPPARNAASPNKHRHRNRVTGESDVIREERMLRDEQREIRSAAAGRGIIMGRRPRNS